LPTAARQICPGIEETDSRVAQCSKFNDRPFRGQLFHWIPYTGYTPGQSPAFIIIIIIIIINIIIIIISIA